MVLLLLSTVLQLTQDGPTFGGGPTLRQTQPCLSIEERARVERSIAEYHQKHGSNQTQANQKYTVFPMGGILGEDLFPVNYVDLDPTTGLRDWDCSNYTYDGHLGTDIDLKSFAEQDAGVPVFAALGGTVVETDDGNFDRNVFGDGQPGNHVILHHGGTQYSLYWHLRRGSVTVKVGDQIQAGQPLGLVGSSGNSTGPHLHFETWSNLGSQFAYEPHTGNCNPGESGWVAQLPVPRQFYVREFDMSLSDFSKYPGLPWEWPRGGTFLTGTRLVGFTSQIQNMAANSTYRVRFLRPNGTVAADSGTGSFNNSQFYRGSWWWWRYQIVLNTAGTWKAELTVNGQVAVSAPFRVGSTFTTNRNLPPNNVTLAMVPPSQAGAPIGVKIVSPTLLDDPDYDVVSYRYVWMQNGKVLRDTTHAGHMDMIPGNAYLSHKDLAVTVTPHDGITAGASKTIHTRLQSIDGSD